MELKFDAAKSVANADLIENGAWLHLRHATLREPGSDEKKRLYLQDAKGNDLLDKPMRVKVRSARSKSFRRADIHNTTKQVAGVQRAKQADKDRIIEEAATYERPKRFSALVIALENFSKDAPMQTPEPQDLVVLADMGEMQWLVDQVMEFAFEDENFGGADPQPEGGATQD